MRARILLLLPPVVVIALCALLFRGRAEQWIERRHGKEKGGASAAGYANRVDELLRYMIGGSTVAGAGTTPSRGSDDVPRGNGGVDVDEDDAVGPGNNDGAIPYKIIGRDARGDDVKMPLVGAGTWQYDDAVAYESVCKSFRAGMNFVDTALGYGNQRGVGDAIRDCYTAGDRRDLFVMTKIPGGLSREQTLASHRQNLWELRLDYVDHLMTHYPAAWDRTASSKTHRQEEWLALEEIYRSGEARSIGISHYCPRHIDDILEVATVTPSINQVEYHVGSGDVDRVIDKCRANNITFMSFSPLCGPCQYDAADSLIHGDLVTDIARSYNVTGSQVSLRYIVQQAMESTDSYIGGVIPKSNNMEHIRSNMDLFSFELSQQDMDRLRTATKPPAETGDCDVP